MPTRVPAGIPSEDMMNRVMNSLGAGVLVVTAMAAWPAMAQAQSESSAVPMQVEVALVRMQGEKRTSSTPFTLMVNADSRGAGQASMRMGVDVPVGTSTSNVTQTSGATTNSPRAVETMRVATEFRNVGTDLDVRVSRVDASTFSVYLSVRDSSIFTSDQTKVPNAMADPTAFRTFSANNTLNMTDGQTRLFGVGTDKITGETLRIEVKLTVLK